MCLWSRHRFLAWGTALAVLLGAAGAGGADDTPAPLRRLVEEQQQEIRRLQKEIDELDARANTAADGPDKTPRYALDQDTVKKIVDDYFRANPGAGMPSGVQTGYASDGGFFLRSTLNPKYRKWDDDSAIPFELRARLRLQIAYFDYKTTDITNHVTNRPAPENANSTRRADFSQLEARRAQLVLTGRAFDPNLRYTINLAGSTLGVPGLPNNGVAQSAGTADPEGQAVPPVRGVSVGSAVRVNQAYVSYTFRSPAAEKGCGPDCPDGTAAYWPTVTVVAGKLRPVLFGLERYFGNWSKQLISDNMDGYYFSVGSQVGLDLEASACDNRLFVQAVVSNGPQTVTPNTLMDDYPAVLAGLWYDFGGSWNREKKAWDLFGDGIPDMEYHCRPVVRLGGSVYVDPLDRRSLYGDAEQRRFAVMPAAPGGTRLINVLNGGDADVESPGSHAVDRFDAYLGNVFVAAKYRGFSFLHEWWLRDLNNFRTAPDGLGDIIYQDRLGPGGSRANALFPGHALVDYGMVVQAGYFLVPRKLEVAARWAWLRGQSGDVNGNGTFRTIALPGVAGPVHVVNGAFSNFHEADEYTVGINYYFQRHALKWQADVGVYEGGNPDRTGAVVAGTKPGVDGYLIRTQLQFSF